MSRQGQVLSSRLTDAVQPLLRRLEADLLEQSKGLAPDRALRKAHAEEKDARRTNAAFEIWRREHVAQIAAAWILSTVFVRTLEDRNLLDRRRLAGPGADDSEALFTELFPFLSTKDYLLAVFREMMRLPAAREVFDPRHNPLWLLSPSSEIARELLAFFRERGDDGESLRWSFAAPDTRFLGDLYQDLNAAIRDKYALLQTPDFIESFILDQTLDPAVERFGLDEFRLVDPACGSGHFLLGAFRRLFDRWRARRPGDSDKDHANRALAAIHGIDVNPYAIAICRFRLILAWLEASGFRRISVAPELHLNLAVADSLLHGAAASGGILTGVLLGEEESRSLAPHEFYLLEDRAAAERILATTFHAVVGNPPYITVKDAALRQKIRDLYPDACSGKYQLVCPFIDRMHRLAVEEGFVGMIVGNAFLKRNFGASLITEVLSQREITRIVDSSGVYIPGHGTPTLLLFGRRRKPMLREVPAVLGKRGEPDVPDEPSDGLVWTEVREHFNEVGFNGDFVSVEAIPRAELDRHPWTLTGGGARDLKARLESAAADTLNDRISSAGVLALTLDDEVFAREPASVPRQGLASLGFGIGEDLRDWFVSTSLRVLNPYAEDWSLSITPTLTKGLWPWRTRLQRRLFFGRTQVERGFDWREFGYLNRERLRSSFSIAFAEVATHNHFVLDRGGKVFKQTAPIIKLQDGATEDDHLFLLGCLNSSVACFWLRTSSFDKGGGGIGGGISSDLWERRQVLAAFIVEQFPIPSFNVRTLALARRADDLGRSRRTAADWLAQALSAGTPLSDGWTRFGHEETAAHRQLVACQEELDWACYEAYALPSIPADASVIDLGIEPEWRPMEVLLARRIAAGKDNPEWFRRHRRTPVTDLDRVPIPARMRGLFERRLALIESSPELRLLEAPEYKRRWPPRDFDAERVEACDAWLLDRIEALFRERRAEPAVMSLEVVVAVLGHDEKVRAVHGLRDPSGALSFREWIAGRMAAMAVPAAAAQRFRETGLEKHQVWREVWDLQRKEDQGLSVESIPKPPEYKDKDFRKPTYKSLRGKLDVPREAFMSLPGAETDAGDPLYGWAGWNHLERARALVTLIERRRSQDGWATPRLLPLLVSLHELIPWLLQWHNDIDAASGERLGESYAGHLRELLHHQGLSPSDLDVWRPPEPTRAARRSSTPPDPDLALESLTRLVTENQEPVSPSDLAEALSTTPAAAKKTLEALLDQGLVTLAPGKKRLYFPPNLTPGSDPDDPE